MKVAESCVTNWFGPSVNPAYVGVYQMKKVNQISLYRYWDGMHWYLGDVTPRKAREKAGVKLRIRASTASLLPWRGLKYKPKRYV